MGGIRHPDPNQLVTTHNAPRQHLTVMWTNLTTLGPRKRDGSGGTALAQNEPIDRRERLRKLALETIDLAKDPYFMHNHLCSYECKFCPTTRATLAHTLGTKRQTNLAKRAARETKDVVAHPQANKRKVVLFLILTWWPSTLYQVI
ncbi:hypothetical protein CRG98_041570 [Punica granatum]|uniref:Uncharacterized protein n=1 Tax=Punica granatum TaxID=22663 RepID=A0A2I0I2U8_PUNGR|nr:hypothetical protein CRG98_041570 [Punica granatum]